MPLIICSDACEARRGFGGWKLRFRRDSVKEKRHQHEVGDDGGDV